MLTWKPKGGKNHDSPQIAEYTMGEEYNNEDTPPHTAVTVEATTSLSLSLSLSHAISIHTRYTTNFTNATTYSNNTLCPKSYLYIYDFRVIYISVLPNRSDGSELGLRSSGSP